MKMNSQAHFRSFSAKNSPSRPLERAEKRVRVGSENVPGTFLGPVPEQELMFRYCSGTGLFH